MSEHPEISIILPVYNGGKTVDRAIKSIVAQSITCWELIIIDDGSCDNTLEILQSWQLRDERIRVICNASNQGISASLNVGWQSSGGAYIARMDADDQCFPTRVEQQLNFLKKNPNIDVLGSAVELIDKFDMSLGYYYKLERHKEIVKKIYKESPFFHPTVMMKRSFLEESKGYDENRRRCEDTELWLRTYNNYTFHNLQVPLLSYKIPDHPPSMHDILETTNVLYSAATKEKKVLNQSLYILRFLLSSILVKLKLREPYTRIVKQ